MGKDNEKRYVIFKDGKKKAITGENGKYWICGKTQFRKASSEIAEIIVEKAEEKAEPMKKKSAGKKKDVKFEEGFDKIPDVSDILAEEIKD